MPIECVPIGNLTPASGVCKIKVRIVRLWGFAKKDKHDEYSAIDLLLLDEKSVGQLETLTQSGTTVGTNSQDAAEPETITVSGSSVGTTTLTSMVSSDKALMDNTCADVNIPTPTSKRSLGNTKDEALQHSSTKPRLMYSVKKEKK